MIVEAGLRPPISTLRRDCQDADLKTADFTILCLTVPFVINWVATTARVDSQCEH